MTIFFLPLGARGLSKGSLVFSFFLKTVFSSLTRMQICTFDLWPPRCWLQAAAASPKNKKKQKEKKEKTPCAPAGDPGAEAAESGSSPATIHQDVDSRFFYDHYFISENIRRKKLLITLWVRSHWSLSWRGWNSVKNIFKLASRIWRRL